MEQGSAKTKRQRRMPCVLHTLLLMSLLLYAGCGEPQAESSDGLAVRDVERPVETERQVAEPPVVAPVPEFSPAEITILPLTELTRGAGGQDQRLNVYVSLADAFGSQIKAPGTFRIELYDYIQRSADPKGQRVAIWPDIDLTSPAENHRYWRDFLRAYEFSVPTQASPDKMYVLEVTCLTTAGRRLSAKWTLQPDN